MSNIPSIADPTDSSTRRPKEEVLELGDNYNPLNLPDFPL
jgi:hypothetical protein